MRKFDIENDSTDFRFFVSVKILGWIKKAIKHSNDTEYEKAKHIYSNLIKAVEFDYASLYTNRWFANFELWLVQEAIHDFKKALLVEPENILTLDWLKMCLESVWEEVKVVEGSVGSNSLDSKDL